MSTNGFPRWLAVPVILAGMVAVLGSGAASAQTEDDPTKVPAGMEVFEGTCAGCHGVDGKGSATGRDLSGVAEQQPDRTVHIASVTNGKGGMPAFGERLSEEEIDAAVTYVRLTFLQDDEDGLEELPRTGASTALLVLGAALLASGAGLHVVGLRADATR